MRVKMMPVCCCFRFYHMYAIIKIKAIRIHKRQAIFESENLNIDPFHQNHFTLLDSMVQLVEREKPQMDSKADDV